MKPKPAAVSTAIATVEPSPVEIMLGNPQWDRLRKILEAVKASLRKSHQDKEELGRELLEIKTRLGFTVPGPKNCQQGESDSNHPQVAVNSNPRTWAQWTRAELGISDDTADRFISYAESFRMLREAIGENPTVLQALNRPFEMLGIEDRKAIREAVNSVEEKKFQLCLRKAFDIKEPRSVKTGGDTSQARKANLAKLTPEIASSLWRAAWNRVAEGADAILKFRKLQDLERWLYLLPLVSGDPEVIGLIEYRDKLATILEDAKDDLEAILKKMDGFIEAKHESANAPVKRVRRKKQPTKN